MKRLVVDDDVVVLPTFYQFPSQTILTYSYIRNSQWGKWKPIICQEFDPREYLSRLPRNFSLWPSYFFAK